MDRKGYAQFCPGKETDKDSETSRRPAQDPGRRPSLLQAPLPHPVVRVSYTRAVVRVSYRHPCRTSEPARAEEPVVLFMHIRVDAEVISASKLRTSALCCEFQVDDPVTVRFATNNHGLASFLVWKQKKNESTLPTVGRAS